jgi:hypothetical protein
MVSRKDAKAPSAFLIKNKILRDLAALREGSY